MLDFVMSRVEFDTNGGCWLWSGRTNSGGYGQLQPGLKRTGVHRFMWEATNGEVPDGLVVMHKCDVRTCVNPAHLQLGTDGDNARDMAAKGRACRGDRKKQSKLDAQKVRDIRTERMTQAEFSRLYGVSESTVLFARLGKTWSWVK